MADIVIGGRLHSAATGNTVAGANEIMDDAMGKKQSVVNQELANRISVAGQQQQAAIEAEAEARAAKDRELKALIDQGIIEGGGIVFDTEPTPDSVNPVTSNGIAGTLGYNIDNVEFVRVVVDAQNRVVFGIQHDGNVYFGAGVPEQIQTYVRDMMATIDLTDITTTLEQITDYLAGKLGTQLTLSEELNGKVDKEEGKSLVDAEVAESFSIEDNPEFLKVYTDYDGKFLWGIQRDGNVVFGAGVPRQIRNSFNEILRILQTCIQVEYSDIQEYVEIVTDAKERIIEATKRNGVKVFPAGIEAPNVPNYSKTVYVKKDGSGDFTKIVDALAYSNRHKDVTIVVSSGIYDLIEELGTDYFDSIPNSYYQGLRIGNGTTIKANGNGVIIKAQYTGSNIYVGHQFSLLNIAGSCTIEGISFIAQNTRYVIHDDPSDAIAESTDYVVTFRNCIFNHKGSTMYDVSQSRPISIGGGCHHDSMHIYDGCMFRTENDLMLADLSYHNASNCYSKVVVTNCYFDRDKTIAGRSDVGGVVDWFVSNNRFGSNPDMRNPEYVHVVDFENIIETNNN